MPTYRQQLARDGVTIEGVVRDGVAFIPDDPLNSGWREYLAWKAVPGNNTTPATPPPVARSDAQALAGSVQTTNATPTELFRATLASGVGYIATLDVIGVLAVSPWDTCVIRASVSAKRTPTASALIGAAVQLAKHADAGAATWTAVASVAGSDFVVTVTGQAGKVINWSLTGGFYRFAPGGLP